MKIIEEKKRLMFKPFQVEFESLLELVLIIQSLRREIIRSKADAHANRVYALERLEETLSSKYRDIKGRDINDFIRRD